MLCPCLWRVFVKSLPTFAQRRVRNRLAAATGAPVRSRYCFRRRRRRATASSGVANGERPPGVSDISFGRDGLTLEIRGPLSRRLRARRRRAVPVVLRCCVRERDSFVGARAILLSKRYDSATFGSRLVVRTAKQK